MKQRWCLSDRFVLDPPGNPWTPQEDFWLEKKQLKNLNKHKFQWEIQRRQEFLGLI